MPAHHIAEEGPLRGLVLNFEEGVSWIIGRDPDEADFVIEDSTVSRKHARVNRTKEGITIKNLSRINKTLVNGTEASEPILLKEGDRLSIGNTVFLFSEKELPDLGQGPKKKKKKGGYDDIFGDLEEPELPPEPEPVEEEIIEPIAQEELPAELRLEEPPPAEEEEKEPVKSAYDTIFEEIGQETEMPFNLLAETPLLLKVIGGPNAGAEIGLEKGRSYTLGKDQTSCDIVFQDLSVSRNHARLTISAEGIISLEDLGSKNGTVVNGAPITEKTSVTSQDLIAMGTTIFLIVDREASQETIYSPITPFYEAPKPTGQEIPEEQPVAAQMQEDVLDWKSRKIPMKHLVMAGSFLLIFMIVFLSFFSLFKSEKLDLVQKAPHEHLKEALAKFPGVHYSFNLTSGKLFLAGHVLTSVDYQEMRYNLSLVPTVSTIENNVVIDETVWKSMNDVLSDNPNWRGVSIIASEPGKFVVRGYIPSTQDAVALAEYLTVNFPYLDRLQNKVVVEENLNTEIAGMLQAKGFATVTYQLANGQIVLAGRYNEKMESDFKETLAALNKLEGVQAVRNFAIATSANASSIDLSQQYTVTGSSMYDKHGYSVVVNGRIYMLGNFVDGMKITSIEPNSILLEKDGLKYKIDYTR